MKERIKKIIEFENISYSKFADIIGIQRSGVSHILSGRNKPSLEVVQKILEAFEYLNTDWLLFGKGEIKKHETQTKLFDEVSEKQENSDKNGNEENINSKSVEISESTKDSAHIFPSSEDKINKENIERIVIFYKNKKFKEYFPE